LTASDKSLRSVRRVSVFDIVIYILVGGFAFLCLYPFLMVVMGSISSQTSIIRNGFTLFPSEISFGAYEALFGNRNRILNAYKITIIVTVLGTVSSLLVNCLIAFTLSRRELRGRRVLNLFVLIPIIFSGGMVPWYIICVNYLGLQDSIQALILPMLANSWNIFLIRNYFYSVPDSLYEAAKMDGASDFTVFFKIYLPVSTPVLATIGLFTTLAYWNDWWLGMMLINREELQPLQLLLRTIIANVQFLRTMNPSPELQLLYAQLPSDAIRMAMVIVTIGPIILVYPFVQKFFVKGIMVGSVKG